MPTRHRFFATCAKGTEGALRKELAALRLAAVRGDRGGVSFEGPLEAGMRACLHSRTAMRVLLELARFAAPDAAALYEGARAVPWDAWLSVRTTLAVEASVSSSGLTHSGYVALKVKDAAVDALRDKLGARPDVDPKDPDVRIVLHLARDAATLSLDLAGEPLHRRGYRAVTTEAPLKETLAAAVLLLGGAAPELPFVDPMAGSGTLAIEQALRARHIAPGLGRAFGFQRWPAYRGGPQSAWDRMKAEAREATLPRAPAPIVARDLHPKAVAAARRNAAAAGVAEDVAVEQGDARDLAPRFAEGTLAMNPPYGERLMSGAEAEQHRGSRGGDRQTREGDGRMRGGDRRTREGDPRMRGGDRRTREGDPRMRGGGPSDERYVAPSPPAEPGERVGERGSIRGAGRETSSGDARLQAKKLQGFYRGVGEMLLRHHGWTALLVCGNPLLERAIPLRPEIDHRLWNGPLEVHLLRYRVP